jgi:2-polyprenyl-3-methyl-5-hydroxy-6-metoxy-1,4-benzoquinol methylase
MVAQLKPEVEVVNALDAALDFLLQTLRECGLYVRAFDGRLESIVEAREEIPAHFSFGQADVEDQDIARLGTFDLVLCFGMAYHLYGSRPFTRLRQCQPTTIFVRHPSMHGDEQRCSRP